MLVFLYESLFSVIVMMCVCVCVCVCVCFEREKRCASVCVVTKHFPGVAASLCVFDF